MQRYGNGLISVARLFAETFGEPALFNRIAASPGENPLAVWQDQLGEARKLMSALRYPEAAEILTSALEKARGLTGPAVDHYLPVTLGGTLTTGEEQRHLLEQAIALNGNLVAAAMARAILHFSTGLDN